MAYLRVETHASVAWRSMVAPSGVKMLARVAKLKIVAMDHIVAATTNKCPCTTIDEGTVPDVPARHFVIKI